MDVFGRGTEEGSRPLLPPGECWICEQSPTQEAIRVIDTRRNARPGGPLVHESVRKYICEDCVTELGQALGMVKADEYALLQSIADSAIEQRDRAEAALAEAESNQTKVVDVREVTGALMPMLALLQKQQADVPVQSPSE